MRILATTALACTMLVGCGAAFRPFADRPTMWEDDDRHPFPGPPAELFTPLGWEQADNALFRPVVDALRWERPSEAIDVNALDEVPDSSWYTNRLSRRRMTYAELQRGACPFEGVPPLPYVIVQGKNGGSSPGAVIEAADGHRYLMKTDFWGQPERGTAADTIATRLLYAAGYDVPCNLVTYVAPGDVVIGADAHRGPHDETPYTEEDLGELFDAATEGPNGTRRVSLSLFLDGEMLGGFHFSGRRDDDPNDVVPHEHRRELRAFYLISAWMNHIDVRPENNADLWVETSEGHGYVRHVILDAGDSFGIVWDQDIDLGLSRRFGNAHYLDVEQVFGDIVSLGLIPRAYRDPPRGPAFEVLGFFDVERFDPEDWRSGYSNPAFEHRTERDMAWMARILARFGDEELRAVVDTGRFSRDLWHDELVRILAGRRDRLLERYLVRLSPLSSPRVESAVLVLDDVAVQSGLRDGRGRSYAATIHAPLARTAPHEAAVEGVAGTVRVLLDRPVTGAYAVVDVATREGGAVESPPARVHLVARESGWAVVGLERPSSADPP